MSLRELYREFEAIGQAQEWQHNRDVLLAYRVEQFHREQRIDVRKHLIGELGRQARRPQTTAEARHALERLAQQYGIPLRRKRVSDGQ